MNVASGAIMYSQQQQASHFTSHATAAVLSLSLSISRDEFCSLTELKRDGRIPTARGERERNAGRATDLPSERRVARQSAVRSVGGMERRPHSRGEVEGDGTTMQNTEGWI